MANQGVQDLWTHRSGITWVKRAMEAMNADGLPDDESIEWGVKKEPWPEPQEMPALREAGRKSGVSKQQNARRNGARKIW